MNRMRTGILACLVGACTTMISSNLAFANEEGYVDIVRPVVDVTDVFTPGDLPQADIPAFPGAEGAGKFSFGGRGGEVYVVTTLEDGGPGSLREAVEAEGPRIVLFNVAGVIHLKEILTITNPYITIAGQTAPGDGVCINGETFRINTHDVVLRYLRFRRGIIQPHMSRDDSVGGNPVGNIMVDHCSFSWGIDENISLYRYAYNAAEGGKHLIGPTRNITIQWSISSECLNTHNHGFGGTWGGRNTSFHHNLFANNVARNPSVGMGFDFNWVNNVIFNWERRTLDGGDYRSRKNIINNYYRPGPATHESAMTRIGRIQPGPDRADGKLMRPQHWYVHGNVIHGNPGISADNWNGGVHFDDNPVIPGERIDFIRSLDPFPMAPITIHTAERAFHLVLDQAGATLPRRDSVDTRVTREVRTGEVTYKEGNGIITDIAQVGGVPEYKGEPYDDADGDGMPDWWEQRFHLDPHSAADARLDLSGDGYSNVECFLNGLDPWQFIDWKDPTRNYNTLLLPNNSLVANAFDVNPDAHPGSLPSEGLPEARLNVTRDFSIDQIVVDGDLQDRAWEQGTMTYGFVTPDGEGAPKAFTRARVIHDYRNLYVGFSAMGQDLATLKAGATDRDGNVAADDAVGLSLDYIDAAGQERTVTLWINSEGVMADAEGDNTGWNIAGLQTAVRMRPGNIWDVEVAIPWEALGTMMPRYHDVWRANFFRHKAAAGDSPEEDSAWIANGGKGELSFGRDALVYVYSKRPFYAPDEVMVFNFSDKLRRMSAQYEDLDGNPVGEEMIIHLGPGHRRQHYAMERPDQGRYRLVIRDRDVMQGDNVLMVVPRPQFGK